LVVSDKLLLFLALTVGVGLGAPACASTGAWPRVVSTVDLRSRPAPSGDWITDYGTALATIATLMRNDLGLPLGDVTLVFQRDQDAFRDALLASGYDQQLAVDAARTMAAVGGFRRVLLNDALLRDLDWPYRVALLAHELTHTLQYEVGGGQRGTSEQWLREGFAEWVEIEVLVALGFTTRAQARAVAARRVRQAASLPALQELVTFPDWVRVAQDVAPDAIYAQAALAAGLLVERHGAPAVLAYFRRFAESPDRLANFRHVFGEDLASFDQSFRTYLDNAVR
jgi:hypothetical protein